MARYIELDSLLAEIEKLVDKGKYHEEFDCAYRDGNNNALYALKEKIDTLEVKEVEEPIEIRFECIPVMASTEIGKSEYQIRANVTEDTLQQILETKIIKML